VVRRLTISVVLAAALTLLALDAVSWVVPVEGDWGIGTRHFIDVRAYKGELRLCYGTHFIDNLRSGLAGTRDVLELWGVLTFRTTVTARNPTHLAAPAPHLKWHRRINTLVLRLWVPIVLLSLYPLMITAHRLYVHRGRRLRRACIHCGYDLCGNTSGRCPECGEKV